jgi:hypothetical protein
MRLHIIRTLLAVLLVSSFAVAVGAEEKSDSFRWGFRERIRQEYIMNALDMDDDQDDDRNHIRVRTQLWLSYSPVENIELYAKINNEHRHYFKPDPDLDFNEFIHELIFENLYVKLSNIAGSPVSVVLGRQNIIYGEGFLYMDGGPLDGSRTQYFNAVKVTASCEKRTIEVHALADPKRDQYLPVVNSQDKDLIEWDESGGGIYYADTSIPKTKLEGYYFYKHEKHEEEAIPASNIHTFGARLSGKPLDWLSCAAEGAYQAGKRVDEYDIGAFGGYIYATAALPAVLEPKLTLGAIYLSGDDQDTDGYEGWNPLYSRWPKWSDLYIYILATENGPAYWDNLSAPFAKLSLKPMERLELIGTIYIMGALQNTPRPWNELFGTGSERGLLSAVKLNWSWTDYLSGHLLWERFDPGDYYAEGSDPAHFMRWEFNFIY